MPPPLLALRELTVRFPGAQRPAVDSLSLALGPGEALGLVGESGSGKSVTALAVMRLLDPSARVEGAIEWEGQNLLALAPAAMRRLRGAAIGMIFQEPMTALNPVMSVGAQIAEALTAHQPGLGRAQVRARVHKAMDAVALPDPARRARDYPHQFSGGQRQRILIAMALVNRPRLLVADEPTTALDVTVQAQILELLARLRREFSLAMLFISHDLAVVSQVAERVAVMRQGRLLELAPARALFQAPRHPYTRALLGAIPTMQTPLGAPLAMLSGAGADTSGELRECAPGHWVRTPVRGLQTAPIAGESRASLTGVEAAAVPE